MAKALKIISGYDPELLARALFEQFTSSQEEVHSEIEKLGYKADEDKRWLIEFSFAFSFRHEETFPDNLAAIPRFPPRLSGKEGFDSGKWNFRTLARLDELPDKMFAPLKALSVLGMSFFSLEMGKNFLSKKRYKDFIEAFLMTHEALSQYRLHVQVIERKTLIARANAIKRHQETYTLHDEVVEHWKTFISPTLSNEKAANVLLKEFPRLSHRKLKQYIAEAKRKGASC